MRSRNADPGLPETPDSTSYVRLCRLVCPTLALEQFMAQGRIAQMKGVSKSASKQGSEARPVTFLDNLLSC